jgi:predicted XRE-type DNA-binding protein
MASNIFEEIGFDKAEADNLRIRSALMREIVNYINMNNLSQKKAAEVFGVNQPRISDLVRGKINKFTIDILVTMLSSVDIPVAVVIDNRIAA